MRDMRAELPPTPLTQILNTYPVLDDEIQRGMAVFVRIDALQRAPESNGHTLNQTAHGLRYLIDQALDHPNSRTRRGRGRLVDPEDDGMLPYLVGAARVLELVQRATPPDTALETAAQNARTKLLLHNMRHVINVSLKFKGLLDDSVLIQEGILGMRKAIDKYDPTREAKLMTFSRPKIFRAVQLVVGRNPRQFSAATKDMREIALLTRTKRYLKKAKKEVTSDNLAEWSGLSRERVEDLERFKPNLSTARTVRLDAPLGTNTTTTFAEKIPAQEDTVENLVEERIILGKRLAELYGKLDNVEQCFTRLRFSLRSVLEVAELLGLKVYEALEMEDSICRKLGIEPEELQKLDEEVAALPARPTAKEEQTAEEKQVFELYNYGSGKGIRSIAEQLDVPRSRVATILKGGRNPSLPKPRQEALLASPWAHNLSQEQRRIARLYDIGLSKVRIGSEFGITPHVVIYKLKEIEEIVTDPSKLSPAELEFNDEEKRLIHLREQGLKGRTLIAAMSLEVRQVWAINRQVAVKRMWQERLSTLKELGLHLGLSR